MAPHAHLTYICIYRVYAVDYSGLLHHEGHDASTSSSSQVHLKHLFDKNKTITRLNSSIESPQYSSHLDMDIEVKPSPGKTIFFENVSVPPLITPPVSPSKEPLDELVAIFAPPSPFADNISVITISDDEDEVDVVSIV